MLVLLKHIRTMMLGRSASECLIKSQYSTNVHGNKKLDDDLYVFPNLKFS